MSVVESLRADAAALLSDGRAKMVLGFRRRGSEVIPAFFTAADQAGALEYDPHSKQNLAAYLRKAEVREHAPVALVAPPAVMRSLMLLAAESQITSDDVLILGVDGETYHGILDLPAAAKLLQERYSQTVYDPQTQKLLADLTAMTPQQRTEFWRRELAKCTRCYACRAACPACYCNRCIVERNTPQWISTAALDHGNYAWNVIRAFHLAGRCSVCGACQDACPQGIPLMVLNEMLSMTVEDELGVQVGLDPEAQPVIGTWNEADKDDYVL